jgi:hypothetical protein
MHEPADAPAMPSLKLLVGWGRRPDQLGIGPVIDNGEFDRFGVPGKLTVNRDLARFRGELFGLCRPPRNVSAVDGFDATIRSCSDDLTQFGGREDAQPLAGISFSVEQNRGSWLDEKRLTLTFTIESIIARRSLQDLAKSV